MKPIKPKYSDTVNAQWPTLKLIISLFGILLFYYTLIAFKS